MKTQVSDAEYEKLRVRAVGPKRRLAVVPEGWHLVASGKVTNEDKYADTVTAKWHPLELDDLVSMQAEDFDALIRKDKS